MNLCIFSLILSIDRLKAVNLFYNFENNDQTQTEINSQELTIRISTVNSLN